MQTEDNNNSNTPETQTGENDITRVLQQSAKQDQKVENEPEKNDKKAVQFQIFRNFISSHLGTQQQKFLFCLKFLHCSLILMLFLSKKNVFVCLLLILVSIIIYFEQLQQAILQKFCQFVEKVRICQKEGKERKEKQLQQQKMKSGSSQKFIKVLITLGYILLIFCLFCQYQDNLYHRRTKYYLQQEIEQYKNLGVNSQKGQNEQAYLLLLHQQKLRERDSDIAKYEKHILFLQQKLLEEQTTVEKLIGYFQAFEKEQQIFKNSANSLAEDRSQLLEELRQCKKRSGQQYIIHDQYQPWFEKQIQSYLKKFEKIQLLMEEVRLSGKVN